MTYKMYRVWAQERHSVPYLVNAHSAEEAMKSVMMAADPTLREEGYRESMIFDGFGNGPFDGGTTGWSADEITVEEKLDQPRSEQQMAKQALLAQDASNFYALTGGFRKAMEDLRKNGYVTDAIRGHPVTMAWLSKLCSMIGDTQHDVWKTSRLEDMAYPTVEKELDRAVQKHEGGS